MHSDEPMSNKDAVLADAISHYCALFDQISARYGADSERAKARMRWIIADAAALRQPTPEKVHTDGSRSGGQPPKPDDAMQHVAYYDEGEFHWMTGIAPRDCELYAKPISAALESSQ